MVVGSWVCDKRQQIVEEGRRAGVSKSTSQQGGREYRSCREDEVKRTWMTQRRVGRGVVGELAAREEIVKMPSSSLGQSRVSTGQTGVSTRTWPASGLVWSWSGLCFRAAALAGCGCGGAIGLWCAHRRRRESERVRGRGVRRWKVEGGRWSRS